MRTSFASLKDDKFKVLVGRRLQLLDQRRDRANVLHLLNIFRIELHSKLFFNGENQIQMLHGIPVVDRLRRRFSRDLVRWNSEDVTGDIPDLLKRAGCQFFPPAIISWVEVLTFTFSLIQLGQRSLELFRSSAHKEPAPLVS